MRRTFSWRGAAVLALAALAGCNDSPIESSIQAPAEDLAAMVEALGFRSDMVQDFGSYVLIEGDIHMTWDELRRAQPRSTDPRGPRFQYRTHNLVGSPKVNTITVDVSGLASQPGWQTAAREALTHWSGIANSYVRMVEAGPADITVSTTCTSSNVAAFASFPSGGNPGSTVFVNTCFGWTTSHAQRVHNMVHELGHTLGFRHSNYVQMGESAGTDGANHIPGTPTSGNASGSVMNGGTALNNWAGFSAADRTAAATVYPLPVPSPAVTYPGGQPNVAWASLSGATSYTVRRVTYTGGYDEFGSFNAFGNQGTITGASSPFVDTSWSYTGAYSCYYDLGSGYWMETGYGYAVDAHFPTGTTTSTISAETASC